MKNLKTYNQITCLPNGSSFIQDTCHIFVNSNKTYIKYIKQDFYNHPFWNYGEQKNNIRTEKISILPFYSKLFKL